MDGRFNLRHIKAVRGQPGFTLIEIMVALMVLAIGLAAVMTSMAGSIRNASGLQERTFAHWVAMNQMAKIQVSGSKAPSTKRGSEEMAGHEWYWTIELSNTADKTGKFKFADVRVKVNEDDESPIVTLRTMVTTK
ncbi:MAG: type II secretion system minor pseudopilin GspI [Thiohalomonadales bacterium]